MGGGNLSLQVHPATGYALGRLGMASTQDESYYILDASSDSRVYLRLHEGVTRSYSPGVTVAQSAPTPAASRSRAAVTTSGKNPR